MQHLDTTMASLANLTAAPPAALYNPLDHGRNLAKEVRNVVDPDTIQSSVRKTRIKESPETVRPVTFSVFPAQ